MNCQHARAGVDTSVRDGSDGTSKLEIVGHAPTLSALLDIVTTSRVADSIYV
jgi:hypothetical protein